MCKYIRHALALQPQKSVGLAPRMPKLPMQCLARPSGPMRPESVRAGSGEVKYPSKIYLTLKWKQHVGSGPLLLYFLLFKSAVVVAGSQIAHDHRIYGGTR